MWPQLQRAHLSASASGCWIWARAQILNGAIRVEDETTLRAAVVDRGPQYKSLRKAEEGILNQIFLSLRVFRPAKHTYLEWNLLGFMELLVLLWFRTFLSEEKAIWCLACDEWSGFPANRGLSRRGKNERFAVARRETRKRIASFKETKYDFSL